MSDKKSPWEQPAPQSPAAPPPTRPSAPRHRLWLWLGLLAAIGVVAFALARAFPEAVRTGDDKAELAFRLGMVVLITAGLLRAARGPISQYLKHAALWTGIVAILALGYAYRAELAEVPQRMKLAFNVGSPVQVAERTLVVPQGEGGHYFVDALLNGQRVRFMVDTGATETVLSPEDARRIGIPVDSLTYAYESETANGKGYGAAYDLTSLEVGAIKLDGFRVMVNKAPMGQSLLGMSFLERLEAFEFRDRQMILKWREDG